LKPAAATGMIPNFAGRRTAIAGYRFEPSRRLVQSSSNRQEHRPIHTNAQRQLSLNNSLIVQKEQKKESMLK